MLNDSEYQKLVAQNRELRREFVSTLWGLACSYVFLITLKLQYTASKVVFFAHTGLWPAGRRK